MLSGDARPHESNERRADDERTADPDRLLTTAACAAAGLFFTLRMMSDRFKSVSPATTVVPSESSKAAIRSIGLSAGRRTRLFTKGAAVPGR
jgi:hypothetical protein